MIESEEINLTGDTFFKLSGAMDCNLDAIEKRYGVLLRAADNGVKISGESTNVVKAEKLIKLLAKLIKQGLTVDKLLVERCADMTEERDNDDIIEMYRDIVAVTARGKQIYCKTIA